MSVRAERRRAWHAVRIETATDPRHRVTAAGDYLRAVLAGLEPAQAARLADAHVEAVLELIGSHTADEVPW